jgi:hypothetical protein
MTPNAVLMGAPAAGMAIVSTVDEHCEVVEVVVACGADAARRRLAEANARGWISFETLGGRRVHLRTRGLVTVRSVTEAGQSRYAQAA